MKDVKFYQLEGKNVLALLSGSVEGAEPIAVGSVDAAKEKHIPVVKRVGDKLEVTVGSVIHPMLEEHHIEWIALATDDKLEVKFLKPGEEPKAVFAAVDSGRAHPRRIACPSDFSSAVPGRSAAPGCRVLCIAS